MNKIKTKCPSTLNYDGHIASTMYPATIVTVCELDLELTMLTLGLQLDGKR